MPLPREYGGQSCSLARSLEVVGERWTLLIVRDAFYGVRSFGEFADHLKIPRAVLTERLNSLVEAGVFERIPHGARSHYQLTGKGRSLWPAVWALMQWGDDHCAGGAPWRVFAHADDDGVLDAAGACARCGRVPPPEEILMSPGPGLAPERDDEDPVTRALRAPRRLLEPLR